MSTVDLVLTDNRLWARSEATHWDGAPSVVPASDGASLVVGEPLQPPYPAVSVVRLAAAGRIAFVPMLPTLADCFAAVLGAVLTNLRMPTACGQLSVVAPSEWGMRRRGALEAGARRLVGELAVEPMALRVAQVTGSISQQQRIAVIELSPLTTTVTLAGRSGNDTWIDSCEHEPTFGSADIAEGRGIGPVADVVDRLLGGRRASHLVVLGLSDPALVDALRTELTQRHGFGVDLRPVSGTELVRGGQSTPPLAVPVRTASPWAGSLHEHAAATQPAAPRRTLIYLGAAALAVVLVVAAAIAVVVSRSGGDSPAVAEPTPSAAPVRPSVAAQTFGRVSAQVPVGWHLTNRTDPRVDLSPENGARERISLIQKPLAAGSGPDEVAAALDTQIGKRPAGTVGPLRRNVIFGGKPGLSYEEFPRDGTTVRWQVLVDSGTQVSVGCQYPTGDWAAIAEVCEKFVGDLRIGT